MKQVFLIIEMDWVERLFLLRGRQQQKSRCLRLLLIAQKRIFFWLTEGKISEYDDRADNLG